MKQPPIVLMIDHNITNILPIPAHNYKNKSNPFVRSSYMIFHSTSVANIIWSDEKNEDLAENN